MCKVYSYVQQIEAAGIHLDLYIYVGAIYPWSERII